MEKEYLCLLRRWPRKAGLRWRVSQFPKGEVIITVLSIEDNQARIGINAPKQLAVHREEIYERIKREQPAGAV